MSEQNPAAPERAGHAALEDQIDQWRGYVRRRRAISAADVDEMEDHLRGQVADLTAGGLDDDEAFLVAVKRMGNLDDVSREFAREHSDRLWKQLVLVPEEPGDTSRWRELGVVLALAVASGIWVKILLDAAAGDDLVLVRNAVFAVLPFLAGYFVWKRRVPWRVSATLLAATAALALVVNLYPFEPGPHDEPGMTLFLAISHTPVVLWLLMGALYAGGAWRSGARRMDYVRFTGELIIYLALIQLGGGLLIGLTFGTLSLVGVDFEPFLADWLLPFAVPGALLVGAWLVEAKKNVVENIAPVLTRVFTPLTIVMLVALFVALLVNGPLTAVDRELLILMDAILVLVLFLLLYSISARDPLAPPGIFDWLQLVLVGAALAVDAVALTAMLTRIAEFGFTANKVAALGLNLVLLVHLGWAAWLALGFVRGHRTFGAIERWQTGYLPVYGIWAAIVVVTFGPLFAFA
ncbi:permease prefix domain 1-containing protein [Promicromonospora sp. NPDC052451]|uniref:permease prefix domain 1-containing protein n=1 Tax=Promicromonospora sp. NPDC052451 TaxID=3364407 RepID=UPI0037C68F10